MIPLAWNELLKNSMIAVFYPAILVLWLPFLLLGNHKALEESHFQLFLLSKLCTDTFIYRFGHTSNLSYGQTGNVLSIIHESATSFFKILEWLAEGVNI